MNRRAIRRLWRSGVVAIACTAALSACGGDAKPSAAFCNDAQTFANATSNAGPFGNQQAIAMLERLRAEAPQALRPDFDTILRLARTQPSSSPATANTADLQKVYEATTRISTYLTDKCRITTPSTTG